MQKSNERSEKLRKVGNEYYSNKRFYEALVKYNESACFAENSSENLGNAFANRSAVYFETRQYEHAINSIKLARQNGYPEKNLNILKTREEKCLEFLKKRRNSEQMRNENLFFQLSHKAKKSLPSIADCLELRCDETYGRHVITNKNLKVGDIIAHDEPFCAVLLSQSKFVDVPDDNIYRRCLNCFRENFLNLVPCENCCEAMFCSENCKNEAYTNFHRFECIVMKQLLKSGSVHMALRLFFTAFSIMKDSIIDLQKFVEENINSNFTIFDVQKEDKEKGKLKALISLVASAKVFDLTQHLEILQCHPIFEEILRDNKQFIEKFLLRMCQISDLNFHGIFSGDGSTSQSVSENPTEAFKNLQKSIGSGAYLFNSLLNHSCANNIIRICSDRKIITVVCQPIPKGSQIFDCYKANFMQFPKQQRQAKLFKEFNFNCKCEACEQNYPTPPALNFKDIKLLKFAIKSEEDIMRSSIKDSRKIYQECCEKLEQNFNNYPCIELCMLQKAVALFMMKKSQMNLFIC